MYTMQFFLNWEMRTTGHQESPKGLMYSMQILLWGLMRIRQKAYVMIALMKS